MNQKTRIRATEIIRDIRGGKTPSALMRKYRISAKGLRSALRKLLKLGAMTQAELDSRPNLYGEAAGAVGLRRIPRKRISKSLWIYDGGNPFEPYLTLDMSEKGLSIRDIRATIGETRTFMVRVGTLESHSTFVFQAQCRWTGGKPEHNGDSVAGFEITSISIEDLRALQRLLREHDRT